MTSVLTIAQFEPPSVLLNRPLGPMLVYSVFGSCGLIITELKKWRGRSELIGLQLTAPSVLLKIPSDDLLRASVAYSVLGFLGSIDSPLTCTFGASGASETGRPALAALHVAPLSMLLKTPPGNVGPLQPA